MSDSIHLLAAHVAPLVLAGCDARFCVIVVSAIALVPLIVAGVVLIGWRWAPLLGTLVFGLLLGLLAMMGGEVAFTLAHPSGAMFSFLLVAITVLAVGLVASISAAVQNFIMIVLIAVSLFLADGINIVAPWITRSIYRAPEYHAAIQRWHDAQQGAYAGILLTGSLLALLWRPREQPLLLQYVALTGLALAAISAPFDPLMIVGFLVPLVLMTATYPAPHSLLHFERHSAPSWPLLTLSLTVAALLAPDVWRALLLQLAGADAHGHYNEPIGPVTLAVALVLAGLLAATKRPGWYTLGLLAGAALIYLGLAAIRLPSQAGSWGYPGGALATVGGSGFVGATLWEARHAKEREGLSEGAALPSEPTAGMRQLQSLGVSVTFYALYNLAFELFFFVAWFTVALIIFWRKSDEPRCPRSCRP